MEANVRSMDNGLTPSMKMPKTMLKEMILRLRSKSVLGGVKNKSPVAVCTNGLQKSTR